MKLSEIAARLGCRVEGDGTVEVRGVGSLDDARAGDVTFLGNLKYLAKAEATKATAILLGKGAPSVGIPAIRVEDAYASFAEVISYFHPVPRPAEPGVHPTALIAKTARLGEGAAIGPFVVIGENTVIGKNACLGAHCVVYRDVTIGDDVVFHARVVIREGTRIGHRVLIQPGAVIGSDGFGFAKQADHTYRKIPQVGIAVIEDDCEIQANACVARATLHETRVGRGTKIDNLAQVGHNCVIGENGILCAQVGLGGSTILGKNVTLGGQAGTGGHQTIGDGATLGGQTGLIGNLEAGRVVAGAPQSDVKDWLRTSLVLPTLPEELRSLRRRLEAHDRRLHSLDGEQSP